MPPWLSALRGAEAEVEARPRSGIQARSVRDWLDVYAAPVATEFRKEFGVDIVDRTLRIVCHRTMLKYQAE